MVTIHWQPTEDSPHLFDPTPTPGAASATTNTQNMSIKVQAAKILEQRSFLVPGELSDLKI